MVFRFKPLATAIGLVSLVHFPSLMAANNDWIKGVAVDGNVKTVASYAKDYNKINNSDVVVNNAQWGFTGNVHEWSTVRLSFLYQQNETSLQVDETFINLGNTKNFPLYLKMGQWYLPFGRDDSLFVSHTVTYNMAGPMRSAALLGFEGGGLYGSVYGYNGQTHKSSNTKVDHYGATLGFTKENDSMSIDVNVNYLNDFGDVSALSREIGNNNDAGGYNWTGYDYVEGISGYARLQMGPLTLVGEYIGALDKFNPTFLPLQKTGVSPKGAEPSAWYAGLGYTLNLGGKETTLAVGYQATDESRNLALLDSRSQPKKRYLACLSVVPVDNTTISLEYSRDTDYEKTDDVNGTGNSADAVALQMSVNF